jgi:hypothetical protein
MEYTLDRIEILQTIWSGWKKWLNGDRKNCGLNLNLNIVSDSILKFSMELPCQSEIMKTITEDLAFYIKRSSAHAGQKEKRHFLLLKQDNKNSIIFECKEIKNYIGTIFPEMHVIHFFEITA